MLKWKAVDMEIPRKSSKKIFTDTVKRSDIRGLFFFFFFWEKGESEDNLGKNRQ